MLDRRKPVQQCVEARRQRTAAHEVHGQNADRYKPEEDASFHGAISFKRFMASDETVQASLCGTRTATSAITASVFSSRALLAAPRLRASATARLRAAS